MDETEKNVHSKFGTMKSICTINKFVFYLQYVHVYSIKLIDPFSKVISVKFQYLKLQNSKCTAVKKYIKCKWQLN